MYAFSSEDCGRTWIFIAQKMPGEEVEDHYASGFEGYDELKMIEVPLSYESKNYMQRSCFYTNMLALDENTAILIYSDFKYPNKDGEPAKTILVRTVTVKEN